ncbi:MAG: glycosyltransferase family 2 protein [Blautia massiliensis (ex Durand et al. 2017)]
MKIVFIILNYNTFQETKDCVLSIESKVDTQNYKIVIVDNLSTDDSADKIEKFIEQKTT